jgi:zinc protease
LFVISARIKEPQGIAPVQAALDATLEDLKSHPADQRRLDAIKSHLKYSFQMRLDTADSVASTLAHILELTGDPEDYNVLYRTYDSLTADDLQAAARKYFHNNNRTVVFLSSEPGAGNGPKP